MPTILLAQGDKDSQNVYKSRDTTLGNILEMLTQS